MFEKFLKAQASTYASAKAELELGKKTSHWMWFIFPQITGLGSSENARYYALADVREAALYLHHPVLGKRLIDLAEILLSLPTNHANEIFGSPDDLKLKSSITLFMLVENTDPVFEKVLNKFFNGEKDNRTISFLKNI